MTTGINMRIVGIENYYLSEEKIYISYYVWRDGERERKRETERQNDREGETYRGREWKLLNKKNSERKRDREK